VTIEWINPAALAGLAAVAGPVVVHLLRRQRAPRVTFPTVQFLAPTHSASARLHHPSDLLLLSLRIAIVAAAAIAAAQPMVATGWRRAAWEQRINRALVVDDSESLAAAASRVRDAVAAERGGSTATSEVHTTNLADGLTQAAAMLQRGTAGRAEIVVISDFQLGALTAADIGALPAEIGLRFAAVDVPRPAGTFRALRTFHAGTDSPLEHEITLDGPRTRVTMVPSGPPARGVKILSAAEQGEGVASLKRIVAAAGAPELPVDRGLTMIFPGARLPDVGPLRAGWMVSAFAVAGADDHLRSLASAYRAESFQLPASSFQQQADRDSIAAASRKLEAGSLPGPKLLSPWTPLAWDGSGHPLVLAAATNQDFVAYVFAAPTELVAAAALRTLLFAIAQPPTWPEREVERLSASQLAAWTREAKTSAGRWRPEPPGDARWLWGLALVLLVIEGFVRRSQVEAREEKAHAA
jgi:hypothetical protein